MFGFRLSDVSDLHSVADECVVELGRDDSTGAIRVTTDDCLACSGCITSAESILVSEQNAESFLANLRSLEAPGCIVSISSEALISGAKKLNISLLQFFTRLQHALASLNPERSIYLSDLELAHFVSFKAFEKLPEGRTWLDTNCTGVVCYIEKFHPGILPNLVPVASPLVIMGRMIQELYPGFEHHSIQCCHDKKIEKALYPGEVQGVVTVSELLTSLQLTDNGMSPITQLACFHDDVFHVAPRLSRDLGADGLHGLQRLILRLPSLQRGGLRGVLASACPLGCFNGAGLPSAPNQSYVEGLIQQFDQLPTLTASLLDASVVHFLEDAFIESQSREFSDRSQTGIDDW